MSMNILAMLISFAMMLTGAGVDGQPTESFRTLLLHDVSLTYNGESVTLAPTLMLGASTDGEKAVFDLGILTEDETLFPLQIGVNNEGITALLQNNDVAVRISADSLNALSQSMSEQIAGVVEGITSQMNDTVNEGDSQLVSVLLNDFIPAYAGMIEAAGNPDYQKELKAKAEASMDKLIDRGEGTPVTELIEGESYDLTAYSYSIDSAQLAVLADTVYTVDDTLSAYYNAMFKLYSVLPAESGLNDISSYADLFAKFKLDMRMDVEEKISGDGEVKLEDATLTIDMNSMMESMAANGNGEETPQIAPIVMKLHAVKVGDVNEGEVSSDFEVSGVGMGLNAYARSEEDGNMRLNMTMKLEQDGASFGDMNIAMDRTVGSENTTTTVDYGFNAQGAQINYTINSVAEANGTSETRFDVSGAMNGTEFGLGFCLDVAYDLIDDLANGHKAFVIDDLSQEGLQALSDNQEFAAVMMQALGSLSGDAQKLMADESVQKLVGLFGAMNAAEYDYEDDSFDGDVAFYDDDFYDYEDYDYEEPEDDGVLPFKTPEFTWLPEGWHIDEMNVDTAYDMVDVTIGNGTGDNYIYAIFYSDADNAQKNYVVAEDGAVKPVDGREISVYDYGDGSLSVTLSEADVYASLTVNSATIDMETVGKLVAGIKF